MCPIENIRVKHNMNVVWSYVLSQICADVMGRRRIHFNNRRNRLLYPGSGCNLLTKRVCSHAFFLRNFIKQHRFTTDELHKLHKRFGNLMAEKQRNVFTCIDFGPTQSVTLFPVKLIWRKRSRFQTNAQTRQRFELWKKKDADFNNTNFVNSFRLYSRPALHVVDGATHDQASRLLPTVATGGI